MADQETRRRAVERILGDESLTDDLTDDAARFLIDWGIARIEGLSPENFESDLADLRRAMKSINREAGKAAPEAQIGQVQALLEEIETVQPLETDNGA